MHVATVAEVFDSNELRAVGYLAAASVAMIRFLIEQRAPEPRPTASWPVYWLLSAVLLALLGLGRATSLAGLISDYGRDQANAEGWYDARRTIQAIVVLAVGAAWLIGVVVAVWRVPPRRRRFLPSIITISALVAFAAIRLISLHQVDSVLYHHAVGGVRFVAVFELLLLLVTIATIALAPRLDEAAMAPGHATTTRRN